MICKKCKTERGEGKFCGKCGSSELLEETSQEAQQEEPVVEEAKKEKPTEEPEKEVVVEAASAEEVKAKPTIQTEEVKEQVSQFSQSVLGVVKHPNDGFHIGKDQFVNGLVSLILIPLFLAISFAKFFYNVVAYYMDSYFDIFIPIFIFALVFQAASVGMTFLLAKLTQSKPDFRTVVARLGYISMPTLFILAITVLISLIEGNFVTLILMLLSTTLIMIIIPTLYWVSYQKEVPVFYFALASIVGNMIIIYFMSNAIFRNFIDSLGPLF